MPRYNTGHRNVLVQLLPTQRISVDFNFNLCQLGVRSGGQDAEAVIAKRVAAAREDMTHFSEFDYVIINDDFALAAADLQAVVKASRLLLVKQMVRHGALIESLLA